MSRLTDVDVGTPSPSKSRAVGRQTSVYLIAFCIFALAISIRVAVLCATRSYLDHEHSEVTRVASSLARGGGFANAYGDTGPTAHTSPLYPLLLSLVYRWFGTGVSGEIAQEILSSFLAALTWSLVPFIGEVCQLDRRVGIGAALAGAVLTINRWAETKGTFETSLASLICLLMVMFYMKRWYSRDFSVRASVFAGVLSGLAILVSASLGSIALGLLLTGYLLFRGSFGRQYRRFAFISVAVMFAMLVPWALRNYFVLGGLVWTRSNFPLELRVSNNDEAGATFFSNNVAMSKYHPFENPQQRVIVKAMGELAYQQKEKDEALRWIRSHPSQFGWLTLQRIYHFWFPEMKRPLQTMVLAFLTVATVPAWFYLLKRRLPLGYGLLTIWLVYPPVYYVVQASPRYVYPIQWTIYLLASQSVLLGYLSLRGREQDVAAND